MAKKEKPETKLCKHCRTEIPYAAKVCPQCRKKQKGGIFKWILIALAAVIVIAIIAGGGNEDSAPADASENAPLSEEFTPTEQAATQSAAENPAEAEPVPAQGAVRVGETLTDGDMQIVYVASGIYHEENEFLQPEAGYRYLFIELACSNIGAEGDESISSFSFNAYADGYAAEQYFVGEEGLSATLSPGRSVTGRVYFTVPEEAQTVEIEYESKLFTDEKITFLYEGEQDSGYVQEGISVRTDGAFAVGETAETDRVRLSYLRCEDWQSDNMFIEPASGNKFISLSFEVENISEDDVNISYFNFTAMPTARAARGAMPATTR